MNIGFNRNKEGYKNSWTDVYDFPDNKAMNFTFEPEDVKGDLYFTINSYTYGMVPHDK